MDSGGKSSANAGSSRNEPQHLHAIDPLSDLAPVCRRAGMRGHLVRVHVQRHLRPNSRYPLA